MSQNILKIGILFLHVIISASCANTGVITTVKKLVIDTDVGGDDAVAVIMALEAEKLGDGPEVIAITCVSGNTDVDHVGLNVLKVLDVEDRLDIPVYKGASHPLILPYTTDYYFGQDGFGDFEYPNAPSADLIQPEHAVNALINLVKKNPGEVTLLALGPLTNVALAIRMYPSFLDDLQQLIVMGGSTEGRGNASPGIEFNFAGDPHANYVVFNSSASRPTTLSPLETTRRGYVTTEFRTSMSEINNTKTWLIDHAGATTIDLTSEYWYCADAVATVVALTSGSIVTESDFYYANAIYDGVYTAGMIVVDYTNVTLNTANTNLVQNIDRDAYEKLLLRYFS